MYPVWNWLGILHGQHPEFPTKIKDKTESENNRSTANGTKYARQILKEAMILTFD
jgi:hypothetical protein